MITVSLHQYIDDKEVFSIDSSLSLLDRTIHFCARKYIDKNPEHYILVKDNGWEIAQFDVRNYLDSQYYML